MRQPLVLLRQYLLCNFVEWDAFLVCVVLFSFFNWAGETSFWSLLPGFRSFKENNFVVISLSFNRGEITFERHFSPLI